LFTTEKIGFVAGGVVFQKPPIDFCNGLGAVLQKGSIYENSTARSILLRSPNVCWTVVPDSCNSRWLAHPAGARAVIDEPVQLTV
jgi:hypothetical protein